MLRSLDQSDYYVQAVVTHISQLFELVYHQIVYVLN